MDPAAALRAYLRARLPVRAVSGVPEIRLHQADPRSGLRRRAERAGHDRPPYWAHPWGGGLVLARFLLDHPKTVAGRTVLDLGTGSGLVAIAAAMAGASTVIAIDVDPDAVAAAATNAALNGVAVVTRCADVMEPDGVLAPVDTVLVGDLFYEPALAARVATHLSRCAAAGQTVLVGDPGRAALPRRSLVPLFESAMPDFGTGDTAAPGGAVYRFGRG